MSSAAPQPEQAHSATLLAATAAAWRSSVIAERARRWSGVATVAAAATAAALWASPSWSVAAVIATAAAPTLAAALAALRVGRRHPDLSLARWAARTLAAGNATAADALELQGALDLAQAAPQRPLVQAIAAAATPMLTALEGAVAARTRRLWRWLAAPAAAWAALGVALALGWLPPADLDETGRRARRLQPRLVGTLVLDLHLSVTPPKYAEGAVAARDEARDEDTVLRGSMVRVSATPLSGVHEVTVELTRQGAAVERVVPSHEADGRIAFAVQVQGPVGYRFVGRDAHDQAVREAGVRALRSRPDEPPRVQLLAPLGEVEVRAGEFLVVEALVEDDIGLSAIELVAARPDGSFVRRGVAVLAGDRRAAVRESIEVDRLELRAGELATLWIEARDQLETTPPRLASSERLVLRMFSPERHHARVLDHLSELAIAWTHALADRIEGDPLTRSVALAGALVDLAGWARQEGELLERLAAVRAEVADDVLVRPQTAADLEAIERRLRSVRGDEDRVVSRIDGTSSGDARAQRRELSRLGRAHAKIVDAIELAVVGLAALAASEHRNALARDGKTLEELDKRLDEVLTKLADDPDNAVLRAEAERLIDAMAAHIEQMAAEAARRLDLVPPEHVNEGALDPAELDAALAGRKDALERVREALRAGDAKGALAALAERRAKLDAAMAALREQVDAERTAEDAALEQLVAELRRGIEAAQRGQRGLRDDLEPHAEAQERGSAEHLRRGLQAAAPQVRDLLDDARDQIRPKRLQSAEMRSSHAIADARAALSHAAAALEKADVDSALMALIEAEERLAGAADLLRQSGRNEPAQVRQRQADVARVEGAADRAARAAATLRAALPRPEALHDAPTRRRLGQLGREQDKVRKRLEKVRHRLGRESSRHPGLDTQVGGRLDHAGQMMRQASSALETGDAAGSERRMSDAAAALDAAEQLLRRGGSPSPSPTEGPGAGSSRVGHGRMPGKLPVLPGSGGDGGEDFRQRLLEASRRRPPEGWSERVRRYWQSLRE